MKFSNGAFLSFAAAIMHCIHVTTAFMPIISHNQGSDHYLAFARTICNDCDRMTTTTRSLFVQHRRKFQTLTRMSLFDEGEDDEDDDDLEPLANGVDSVSWLPTVIGARGEAITKTEQGAEILPLFPLGGIVYIPNSEHVLNIFEPRYRQMYSDILMNGTKRFVVSMSHPSAPGRFAQMGVLFELEDLKEVSEQTADQVKYVCNHKVTGRVKIHRVLNPEAWESRQTYLKVEGTIEDDSDKNGDASTIIGSMVANPQEEEALKKSFSELVEIQHELEEDVRFTRSSVGSLAVKPGAGKDGLWQTISLWKAFADQRLVTRQNELQRDFQQKLQAFLKKEKGLKDEELPSAIGFQELSPALQQEIQELQKRMTIELKPLILESTLTMQKILEGADHTSRCQLLRYFIESERKRLNTKKALTGMFSGTTTTTTDSTNKFPAEEQLSESEKKVTKKESASSSPSSASAATLDATTSTKPQSIFMDEPDAFQ